MLNSRKAESRRQAALERLRKEQRAATEYVRIRLERGLTEKFDAWETKAGAGPAPARPTDSTRGVPPRDHAH